MAKEQRNLQMVIYTKGSTPEESQMDMESIIGQMAVITKEDSKRD